MICRCLWVAGVCVRSKSMLKRNHFSDVSIDKKYEIPTVFGDYSQFVQTDYQSGSHGFLIQ